MESRSPRAKKHTLENMGCMGRCNICLKVLGKSGAYFNCNYCKLLYINIQKDALGTGRGTWGCVGGCGVSLNDKNHVVKLSGGAFCQYALHTSASYSERAKRVLPLDSHFCPPFRAYRK
jgi:hypothetical protein